MWIGFVGHQSVGCVNHRLTDICMWVNGSNDGYILSHHFPESSKPMSIHVWICFTNACSMWYNKATINRQMFLQFAKHFTHKVFKSILSYSATRCCFCIHDRNNLDISLTHCFNHASYLMVCMAVLRNDILSKMPMALTELIQSGYPFCKGIGFMHDAQQRYPHAQVFGE